MALPDNSQNYADVNQGIDRITEILKTQSTPQAYSSFQPQASQLPMNILNAINYSGRSYPGAMSNSNFAGDVQKYEMNQQNQQLNQQQSLLNAYEAKLKMGDAQTKALDDKIKMFVGDDPYGKETILRELHALPDNIDPASPATYSIIAGIAKRNGLQNVERDLELAGKRAQINAANALASKRNSDPSLKPLPPVAIRLQNDALDAIGTASNIDADLGAVIQKIDNKELKLGPVDNVISEGRNYLGVSSKNSRNFATFKTTLEKMRNDSLRLNKGVQTEGDSVRAWNEILQNITDEPLVRQRLEEVREINRRGAELQQLNMDNIRANYGYEPLDTSNYRKPAAILGGGSIDEDPRIQQARDAGYSDEEIQQYLGGGQ